MILEKTSQKELLSMRDICKYVTHLQGQGLIGDIYFIALVQIYRELDRRDNVGAAEKETENVINKQR